jgi:Domain of unknown function (DUF4418)
VKVLAVIIALAALVIIVVPQFTNCESGKDNAATKTMTISESGSTAGVTYASTGSTMGDGAAAALPYRMMKCYWTAQAGIVAGVPLIAIGALLLFARRKESIRALGILTAVLGVLTILLTTSIIGTCLNDEMVCNTQMKPVLLIGGGITVALGIAVVAMGQMRRENGGGGVAAA